MGVNRVSINYPVLFFLIAFVIACISGVMYLIRNYSLRKTSIDNRSGDILEKGLEWINLKEEITTEMVNEVGKTLSVNFPKDYINHVTKYHGATPKPNTIKFGDNEEETIESLLSFNSSDEDYILKVYGDNDIRYYIGEGIIPFAKTKWIDLICFDYRNGGDIEPTIVYWNYDLSLEDVKEGIEPICNTYTDFLFKLSSQR